MNETLTFYFPTNYLHGNLSKTYYHETINILSVEDRNQDFLNRLFKETKLYKHLRFLSYNPYINWGKIGNVYIAYPKIKVYYEGFCLSYFHIPTYEEVSLDFYLLTDSKNSIKHSKELIIKDKELCGNYILSIK